MGWWQRIFGGGRTEEEQPLAIPAPPTTEQIVTSVDAVLARASGKAPAAVTARVQRVAETVHEMVPRLDRLGAGSQQAHTVVATATSYLPEAVDAYLRLPRDFADRRVVDRGKTSLLILCDQLDLLGATLDKISDAVSRADAVALVAHGRFLEEKFGGSGGLTLPSAGTGQALPGQPLPGPGTAGPGTASGPAPLEAP
ncbi:hypothetical protein GCM10010413_08180 [Promicromonospora sukumoe]|uniref:Uncharacterized protein n=1 Tax=Promicromonospora sukumoe TaxID=88382 RepID=A0A7W3J549_9MICO|nr:hypothetical protein [Promicromonospora sukumoe]MBA8806491.1 hypothetical protein [Promicromonospora sukumoe]